MLDLFQLHMFPPKNNVQIFLQKAFMDQHFFTWLPSSKWLIFIYQLEGECWEICHLFLFIICIFFLLFFIIIPSYLYLSNCHWDNGSIMLGLFVPNTKCIGTLFKWASFHWMKRGHIFFVIIYFYLYVSSIIRHIGFEALQYHLFLSIL